MSSIFFPKIYSHQKSPLTFKHSNHNKSTFNSQWHWACFNFLLNFHLKFFWWNSDAFPNVNWKFLKCSSVVIAFGHWAAFKCKFSILLSTLKIFIDRKFCAKFHKIFGSYANMDVHTQSEREREFSNKIHFADRVQML